MLFWSTVNTVEDVRRGFQGYTNNAKTFLKSSLNGETEGNVVILKSLYGARRKQVLLSEQMIGRKKASENLWHAWEIAYKAMSGKY